MRATAPASASPADERQDQPEAALLQHAARDSRPAPSAASTSGGHLRPERLLAEAERVRPDLLGAPARDLAPLERVDQRRRRLLAEEEPGHAVDDRLGERAPPVGDDGPAGGRGLERRDAELLLAGEEERPAAGDGLAHRRVGLPAEEADRGARAPAEARELGAAPDHVEAPAEPAARVHRDVEPLVRREGRHAEVRVTDGARLDRPEEARPHRRVDDARRHGSRRARIRAATCCEMHATWPARRPAARSHRRRAARAARSAPPRERRHPPDVGVLEGPRVAHRREAVDHVRGAGGRTRPDRDAVARRQDEVVAPEVEAAHREGEQREVLAEAARRARQPLDERRPDRARLDGRGDAAGDVDQCEDVGCGKETDQALQDALPAPHAGQPVMDQRDPHQSPIPQGSQRLPVDGNRGFGDVSPGKCARAGQTTGPERGAERFLTRQSIHSLAQTRQRRWGRRAGPHRRRPRASPPRFAAITGAPHAIASRAASPKPSQRDGHTTTVALW